MRSDLARDYLRALEQCAIDIAPMPRDDAATRAVVASVERQLLEHLDRDKPDALEMGALIAYWCERLERHRRASEGGASS